MKMKGLKYEECKSCNDWDGCISTCMEICMHPIEALEEFNHYKDLEEQGLLLKLLCKMGDTVYEIQPLTNKITPRTIKSIVIGYAPDLTLMYKSGFGYIIVQEDFGKTVFLTQSGAEEALQKLKGEMNE